MMLPEDSCCVCDIEQCDDFECLANLPYTSLKLRTRCGQWLFSALSQPSKDCRSQRLASTVCGIKRPEQHAGRVWGIRTLVRVNIRIPGKQIAKCLFRRVIELR
jgi:hypothetical protein